MSDKDHVIRDLQDSWSKSNVVESKNCPKCGQPMEHHETEDGETVWTCQKCDLAIQLYTPLWIKTVKFFVHGIAFTALFFVLEILWIFSSAFLLAIGSLLGLIIGLLFLLFIVGAANSVVSRFVWGFSMNVSATSIFLHGLVLFLILLGIDIALMLPILAFPGNSIVIAAKFIVSCFLYGLVGKKIAEKWAE